MMTRSGSRIELGALRARFAGAIALALLAAGSVAAEKVTLTGQFPANNAEASQLRRLSIGSFDGNGGAEMRAALQSQLATGEGADPPWFTLVVAGTRTRRGGSDGTLSGSSQVSVSETPVERRTYTCAQYSGKKCVAYATISCIVRVVNVVAEARITRASDGRIVYSATKPLRDEIQWCAGQVPQRSAQESATQLALIAARDIKRDVSPYRESYTLKIKEDTDGMPKATKARFKTAVKLSEKKLGGSCRTWESLRGEAPTSASLIFNLGICAEARGDFAGAGSLYDQAQALDSDGSRRTAEAASRIRQLIAAREQTAQQQGRRARVEAAEVQAEAQAQRQAAANAAAAAREQRTAQARAQREAAARTASARAQQDARRQQVVARHGAAAADAIIAGRVQMGMTAAQVQAAIGAPSRRERIGPGEEQWLYPGRRVIFRSGRVSYVGN